MRKSKLNMRVAVSKELTARIAARMKAIISDLSSSNVDLRKITAEIPALPLYFDSGGGLALKPTGELVEFSWDDVKDVQEVNDLRLMNIALFQGSKKYPELEALIPVMPSNATVCPYCKGTGYPSAALNSNIENIVCYCGGVGWIP